MDNNDVVLGQGKVDGMFYHGPEKSTMPVGPFSEPGEAFVEAGFLNEDGPSWTPYGSREVIRSWDKVVRRQFASERGSVSVSIISTSEESLKTVFGEENVTVTPATAEHGKLISVNTANGPSSVREAFILLGNDGETGIMLSCPSGSVTEISDVSFTPTGAITWTIKIEGNWTLTKDDGQKVETASQNN